MPGSFLSDVKGFTPVVDALAEELGLIPAVVYGVAWRFCQMRDGVCHASLETIAKRVGISRRTVQRHIHELCTAGYLEDLTPERTHRPHRYRDTGKAQIVGLVAARVGATQSPTPEPTGRTESPTRCDRESDLGRTESPTRCDRESDLGRTESPISRVSEETIQESSTVTDRARLFRMIAKAGAVVNSSQSEHYALLLEDFDIETIGLAFQEAEKQHGPVRWQYIQAILEQSKARGCKPGEWTPEKQEPAGKPYARDGPLRTVKYVASDGSLKKGTVG